MFGKINKIANDVAQIRVDVAKNTVTLEQNTKDIAKHISRTDKLEEQVMAMPINFIKWSLAAFTAISGLGASIYGVYQFVKGTLAP